MLLEQAFNLGRLERLAPGQFIAHDLDAEPLGDQPPPLRELARLQHQGLAGAGHKIHHSCLHASAAGTGKDDHVVGGLEDIFQSTEHIAHRLAELGRAMMANLPGHCQQGCLRDFDGAGGEEAFLGHIEGCKSWKFGPTTTISSKDRNHEISKGRRSCDRRPLRMMPTFVFSSFRAFVIPQLRCWSVRIFAYSACLGLSLRTQPEDSRATAKWLDPTARDSRWRFMGCGAGNATAEITTRNTASFVVPALAGFLCIFSADHGARAAPRAPCPGLCRSSSEIPAVIAPLWYVGVE